MRHDWGWAVYIFERPSEVGAIELRHSGFLGQYMV
jgi:hypothetical protein